MTVVCSRLEKVGFPFRCGFLHMQSCHAAVSKAILGSLGKGELFLPEDLQLLMFPLVFSTLVSSLVLKVQDLGISILVLLHLTVLLRLKQDISLPKKKKTQTHIYKDRIILCGGSQAFSSCKVFLLVSVKFFIALCMLKVWHFPHSVLYVSYLLIY